MHIISVDPSIQFTVEQSKKDGSIPFLDTSISSKPNGTFTVGVYRKPTHLDLYLPWDSYYNLSAQYSVINTLSHRAHTICSTLELLKNELYPLEKVCMICKYSTSNKKRKKARRSRPLQPNTLQKMPYSSTLYTRHM